MSDAAPVWLYALTLNETRMLGFFLRHYEDWVDRFIFYDDGSTDDTVEILRAHPKAEMRRFERLDPSSFVESSRLWQNSVWKEARGQAAWAVITALDEHLYHPRMPAYLEACRTAGVTAIPALGFHMISDLVPPNGAWLAETCRTGMPHEEMSKLSLLDPDAVTETNFRHGRHVAKPEGRVVYPEVDELYNLHYKFIDKEYLRARHRLLRKGLRDGDVSNGFGEHYDWTDEEFEAKWQAVRRSAIDYRDPSVGFSTHTDRWWRGVRFRG